MNEALEKLKEAEALLVKEEKEVYAVLVRKLIVYMEIYVDTNRKKSL